MQSHHPTDYRLVLATDLDGTFLGGSDVERAELYEWIEANRRDVALIFVTGRDLPFIRELVAGTNVPQPDYVIGDVGTTIAGGPDILPMTALEQPIADLWGDAGLRVRTMLQHEPGLTLQPIELRYRVSYLYEPAKLASDLRNRVEAMGFDCLTSADLYLDVLPKGISKGPTLKRLVEHLGLRADAVLVAGDTLNDLSLFETGYHAVAVANSETLLRQKLSALPHVFQSTGNGAAGITEAIRYHSFFAEVPA